MPKKNSRSTAVLPLGIKDRMCTELPALVALTAIGEPWFSELHQTDLLAVALVTAELAPLGSDQAACAAELRRLCERPLTLHDKVAVALNLAECLPWLQLQPNTRVDRALRTLLARCEPQAPQPSQSPQAPAESPLAAAA